jgi:hypothetical protein
MKKHPVLDALAKAVKGLLYISESESPLEPFLWEDQGELTERHLLQWTGIGKGTTVTEESLGSFLRAVRSEEKSDVDTLGMVIKEQLSVLRVFRIGDALEKEVYVVGKTNDGCWAGVKTSVIDRPRSQPKVRRIT